MNREDLIDVAHRIGRRIAGQALWDGPACTWEVEAFDLASGDRKRRAATGEVYQGTAGIALFLGELHRATGDPEAARAAVGGLHHALAHAAGLPGWSFGFHNGRVGIAWVAARLAALLERPELLDAAVATLEPLAGNEDRDSGLDVISGAAGAIPALLELAAGGREPLLGMAVRLGDHLVAAARREPGGWSWGTVGSSATRYLAGLGHGAAGVGVALLELARATGRGDFRFAAEMAFLYERRLFDEASSNWPDLRHRELGNLLFSGDPDAVKKALAAGAIAPYERRSMSAWCHGAPGIGLARLRAFELTGRPLYRREAEAALVPTLRAMARLEYENFSLCHGSGGNAELPWRAAELFGDPALAQACHRVAEHGWESCERAGRPWPCGTMDQVSDPSLMLGEAGIGHFYLRLAGAAAPVLLLSPRPAAAVEEDGGFVAAGGREVAESFGGTLAAVVALGIEPAPLALAPPAAGQGGPLVTSPVEAAAETLRRLVRRQRGAARTRLEDAWRVERERYELAAVPNDLTRGYLRGLTRPPAEALGGDARLGLAEDVRLVTTRWDWSAWLDARSGGAAPEGGPPERETAWLVARQGDRLLTRRLSPFAAALLAALEPPATLDEVTERLAGTLAGAVDRGQLRDTVSRQVRELYRAGLIDELATPEGRRAAAGS